MFRDYLNYLNFFLWFDNLYIPYIFSIIILICVILGLYPRYLCFLHSWIAYSVFYSMLIVEGGDQINAILTFLIIPICILDNRKNGWKKGSNLINHNSLLYINANVAEKFIKIQMAVLYLNAAIAKIYATEWSNGTATYYWFFDNIFGAPTYLQNLIGFLFKNNFPVTFITWGVIFLELTLAIAIFFNKRNKLQLFVVAFIFHLSIFLIHGLATFWLSMSAGLVLYLFQLDKSISYNYFAIKKSFIQKHDQT